MSSRDKMSTTSLPKEHLNDRAPSSAAATTATKSRTSRQSTSGSHRDNNNKDNRTSSSRGGNASSKRPTKNGSTPTTKTTTTTTTTTTRTTNKSHKSGHASSANIDDSNELTTSGYSGEDLNLSTNTDTSMSNPRAATAEQETNIDGGDLLDLSTADASASASASEERDESDAESSCLLSSSATLLDSPANRPAQREANGGTVAPITSDLSNHKARILSDTSATAAAASNNTSLLPDGWEQHTDKLGAYYWHVSTGVIQRDRPAGELAPVSKQSVLVCHDDEEINQITLKTSDSDDDEDYYESGAALTLDDTSETTFVVYPLGCCEFDETQLVSAASTKTIQKCILRLCNMPTAEESVCWGLDQSQPILMKLHQEYIQFTDLKTRNLLRSQPINSIKTWAVDDDNNFAFVIEDRAQQQQHSAANDEQSSDFFESVDYALLSEPRLMCYVFRSMDDDDMSCKVAAKLNEEINRYKEQLTKRITNSTRLQQMIVEPVPPGATDIDQITDAEEDFECLETSNEITLNVKYIGKTPVPRPTGIDVLNASIDKCLAEASNRAMIERSNSDQQLSSSIPTDEQQQQRRRPSGSTLIDAKLHVSPSSVIVENASNGEIIVECRIRYLTFMGISRRDIRWCGFIMQNSNNKTFVTHCFECHPTAGPVCDAIQQSCTRMFEKVIKNARRPSNETMSIIPTKSKIRNTLAKTFARIKLNNPIA